MTTNKESLAPVGQRKIHCSGRKCDFIESGGNADRKSDAGTKQSKKVAKFFVKGFPILPLSSI
jgi:hypothetical protein